MRKFMKGCGITAIIMLVTGLILTGVVTIIKGRSYLNNFFFSMADGRFDSWMNWLEDADWETGEYAFEGYDIDEYSMYNETYNIDYADFSYEFDISSANKLDMNLAGCSFDIYDSDDDTFWIESSGSIKMQAYQENGTVYIKGTNSHNNLEDFGDSMVTLYIPEGLHFDEANIEMGAGRMYVGSLNADKMVLNVGAGQIEGDGITADTISVKVGAGSVDLYDLTARTINGKVDMGRLYVEGAVNGDINCESAMGNVMLELDGSEKDYNYDVKCSAGSVYIDGESFSGVDYSKKIDNGADKKITLHTSLGGIDVSFY